MKKEKKKHAHSLISDFGYVLRTMLCEYPVVAAIAGIWTIALPITELAFPFIGKYAMEIITAPDMRKTSIIILAALLMVKFISECTSRICRQHISLCGANKLSRIFRKKLFIKRMTMDYQNVELTSTSDIYQKAADSTEVILFSIDTMRNGFSNIVQVITYTVILADLSPVMLLVTAAPFLLCFLINKRVYDWRWRNTDKWIRLDRQLDYIAAASSDFSYAKDIRLYGMSGLLEKKFLQIFEKRLFWLKKFDRQNTVWRIIMELIIGLSLFAKYVIAIYMVWKGNIGAGDFVLYFTSMQNYGNSVWALADNISGFSWFRDNIDNYRNYLEIPDKFNHGKGKKLPTGQCEIEFKNVSYTYPNADDPTINNISFKLHKGERLALVGLNGAGKSTLIKLMCGLYDPTEGEILLNGIDVREFNREEYYSLFGTVFQDHDILPVTVAQNITGSSDINHNKSAVNEALQQSGLYGKIQTLPQKENTLLAKSVFDNATDLSGGEMQKLALAKALYKDAPLLILDEPTAALDPISEQEMYLHYAKFSKGKASVFISHRLASTRFCDNIILIENGRIAEQGSHKELMKKGGKYAELFEIQSAYYTDKKEVPDI